MAEEHSEQEESSDRSASAPAALREPAGAGLASAKRLRLRREVMPVTHEHRWTAAIAAIAAVLGVGMGLTFSRLAGAGHCHRPAIAPSHASARVEVVGRRQGPVIAPHGSVAWLGVEVRSRRAGKDVSGAQVADVIGGTPAAAAGLSAGDVVLALDGEELHGGDDLVRAVRRREPGTAVSLRVRRPDGALESLEVVLSKIERRYLQRVVSRRKR